MSGLRVLFETRSWLAVDKPAGLLVIPGRSEEDGPSLREQLGAQLGRRVWVVHRLDRDTTGVLVLALDASAHRALSMAFEAGKVSKRYLALVEGRVEEPLDVELALVPARRGRMRPARAGEEGKEARTRIHPREVFRASSLVEVEPLTGRTHQIRVHLRSVGHPLLVDHQYGRSEPLRTSDLGLPGQEELLARTPLHAARVEIPPFEGIRPAFIEAPMPADMARTLEALRAGSAG